jgi:nucleoside-diphosphate-sugar epimerase
MLNQKPLIGILGCGWLGFDLAKSLIKSGYTVYGTIRREEEIEKLQQAGIRALQIKIDGKKIYGDLKAFLEPIDHLIITLPPDLKNQNSSMAYRLKMILTFAEVYDIKRVLYTSSIGVFKDAEDIPIYDENSTPNATSERAIELFKAEKTVFEMAVEPIVIRLGGLIGGDRHPVKYLSGREDVPNPDAPVNLTNRNYAIDKMIKILELPAPKKIYHLISESHSKRSVYYAQEAMKRNLEAPQFSKDGKSEGKKIVSVYLSVPSF